MKLTESHIAAQRTAEESSKLGAAKKDRRAQGLVNRDEEEYHRGTLPKRYADLEDHHFPLFVTFDQLSRLLEAHVADKGLVSDAVEGADNAQTDSNDYMLQRRDSFVSYTVFLTSYWPHLPQHLTKGLGK